MKSNKIPKQRQKDKVEKVAKILGITTLLKRLPKDLSGGQRQRVAMGRAMVRNPKVFLFDEPLSNLDAQLRMELRAEIKALHQTLKTTIVYVTHDQIEAMTLADNIVVMKAGLIAQQGSPLEVYDYPINTFVAQFIGSPSMNLMSGTLRKSKEQWMIECGSNIWPVSERWLLGECDDGRAIQFGIRPSDLRLNEEKNEAEARIRVVEMTGDMTLLHLDWLETKVHLQHYGRLGLNAGDSVSLTFSPDSVHLFDAQTTNRLKERR